MRVNVSTSFNVSGRIRGRMNVRFTMKVIILGLDLDEYYD